MNLSMNSAPVEDLTYEEAFAALEAVVSVLETEKRPLDEAMALFERGQALVQRCASLLEQAELRIRQLSSAPDEQEDENSQA
ncbi:MAG: exodeoxyribonuclease VII small subunit [Anaerolineales bacterium]|jgi:exodeoxyribonuclease VII small subunit|nr:exodeoxyribonuclease VII small subunit [Anaerolineales bacterium]